jgi:hypothetical protein
MADTVNCGLEIESGRAWRNGAGVSDSARRPKRFQRDDHLFGGGFTVPDYCLPGEGVISFKNNSGRGYDLSSIIPASKLPSRNGCSLSSWRMTFSNGHKPPPPDNLRIGALIGRSTAGRDIPGRTRHQCGCRLLPRVPASSTLFG